MRARRRVHEILGFLKANKAWWVGSILALLALLALLLVTAQGSPVGPFVYTRF